MVEQSHTAGGWYPSLLRPFQDMGHKIAGYFAPSADAAATGDEYEITMELPGVSGDDISIDLSDDNMTIRGEKKTEREEEGKTYFFSERVFGSFERSFRLPANADAKNVSANFTDGVLTVRIPKSGPPPEKKRRIEIKQG